MTNTLTTERLDEIEGKAKSVFARSPAANACLELCAALRASQARESALRSALESIAESHDAGRHDGEPEPCPARDGYDMWLIARAALTPQDQKEAR